MTALAEPRDRTLTRVYALAMPLAAALGVDLVDILWATEGGRRTLRVTIERAALAKAGADASVGWGVSLEDCAELSRDLSHALDLEDAVPGAYNLEVSSPGLDRPLRTVADFRRFQGQLSKAKLARPAPDGQRVLRGPIASVEGDAGSERVTVEVDGKPITVPFVDIVDAHLVFELAPPQRPGKKGAPASKKKSAADPRSRASAADVRSAKPSKGGAGPTGGASEGRSSVGDSSPTDIADRPKVGRANVRSES
ncbi:MAG TPA: ribosome maturation factor RimP [Polyangiaceae bacterium]|jgi:ribosome maturation factor RimP|nr:ribosome maturation factor RimP [Polyangiaceae bacterium]